MDLNLIVNIVIVIALILLLIAMWKKGYKKQVKEILLVLVIQAEKAWGSGTGAVKFSYVYSRLPVIITILFTKNDIEKMINDTVEHMKEYIESNIEARTSIGI